MVNAAAAAGSHDVLLITLDALRYDAAALALSAGQTPFLQSVLPGGKWEARHTPGNFTYAAHHAFFAGYLPTPVTPGPHPRLFAARFQGSQTTGPGTWTFDAPDIVSGLASAGYHTVCIGGVGFFNKQNPLGLVFPSLFAESHWSPEMGVTGRESTRRQVDLAVRILTARAAQPVLLFINVSAIHQPNRDYLPGAEKDSVESQRAALAYVDSQLPPLFAAFEARRRPVLAVVTSDHGTAYGEDGYHGHRVNHPVVWTVPYAELIVNPEVSRQ